MNKLLISIVVVLVVVGVVGFFAPKDYAFERQITINATPEQVHDYVGDLEKWPQWAPWAEADPDMVVKPGARSTGVGASQSWSGKDGDGELIFTRSDPSKGIAYEMAFIMDGDRVPANSEMTYNKVGNATQVTWSMAGSWQDVVPPVMDGWMTLMAPMMMGSHFDKGLAKLKLVVENA